MGAVAVFGRYRALYMGPESGQEYCHPDIGQFSADAQLHSPCLYHPGIAGHMGASGKGGQPSGPGSGVKGMALAVLLGVANAGPLYAAFPVVAVMLKKGTSLFDVILFIGAWATLKIPMFLFEIQFLGVPFSTTRWVCSLIGIISIAYVTDRMHSEAEKQAIYLKHQQV